MRNLIDLNEFHYNPTGPGDYNLPSSFGELPPPRANEVGKRLEQIVKKPPAYSIGVPIKDTRILSNDMVALQSSFHSIGAPPLGTYNPIDPKKSSFEDKAKLKLMRASNRFNPYMSR